MIRGLYTSALGMNTQMSKMNVVSNNIANADTTGFKRDMVVTRSFSEELMNRLDDKGDVAHSKKIGFSTPGVFVDDIYTDFSNGSFTHTNATLDVSLDSEGFFSFSVMENGAEVTKYGRDGAFTLGPERELLNKQGHKVLGENGAITLPEGAVEIDDLGNIFVNSELVDKLLLINVSDNHSLRKFGNNLYNVTPETEIEPYAGKVINGYLENSNINSVKEMVEMITVARTYEANQRMITIHDTTLGKAVNEIARR